jgi:BASS family bile acid:Na+ symporter
MGPADIVKLALQMSIMLTVFGFGLRATVEDALYLVRHPRMLVISLVSMLIVMPFIALALVLAFDPPQLARVALVALALSPVPPILLTGQRKAGGQAAYGRADGGRFHPVGRARSRVGGVSGATDGQSVRTGPRGRRRADCGGRGAAPGSGDAWCALSCPVWQTGWKNRSRWWRMYCCRQWQWQWQWQRQRQWSCSSPRSRGSHQVFTFGTVAAIIVLTVLGLAFGHILAGPDPGDSAVLALASAVRHPGIAWRSRARTSRRWMSGR